MGLGPNTMSLDEFLTKLNGIVGSDQSLGDIDVFFVAEKAGPFYVSEIYGYRHLSDVGLNHFGEAGGFQLNLVKEPRTIDKSVCGCGPSSVCSCCADPDPDCKPSRDMEDLLEHIMELSCGLYDDWESIQERVRQLAKEGDDAQGAIMEALDENSATRILKLRIEELKKQHDDDCNKSERLLQEAQIQAQEMRTHQSTVREIYQVITGNTGEPGDWNGAEPVRKLKEENERLEKMLPFSVRGKLQEVVDQDTEQDTGDRADRWSVLVDANERLRIIIERALPSARNNTLDPGAADWVNDAVATLKEGG